MEYWIKYPELQEELLEVNDYLRKSVVSKNKQLSEITLNLIESGGKRLRPAFVLLAAKVGEEYNKDVIIPLSASIELIHTATLIHDDIIDESTFRRGNKSIHDKWGKDMAIYIGDFLLAKSFLLLSQNTTFDNMSIVAKFVKSICEGEINQYQRKYKVNTKYEYLKNIYKKTALLFGLSLGIGSYQAKASLNYRRSLIKFGVNYGMAFQICDDLLDYTSDVETIGKSVHNDLKQGYYTLPLIFAMEDKEKGQEIKDLIKNKENITDKEVETIIQLTKSTNAIQESKALLYKFLAKAEASIQEINNLEVKNIFEDLILKIK